jgi:hypothetical protein
LGGRKQFAEEYTESRDYATEVDMDSGVLPRFFYPEIYKKESQIAHLVLIDHNNHFGSNMPLKPDISKFYERITEDDNFMHLKDELTAEDLEEEIESHLKNGWRLSDLRVSSTSSASIEGEGLVKCCNTIYGDSRAMPGLPIEFHPTCPFPNCCYFSPKAARIVEHYKRGHKDEISRNLARNNSAVRAFMDSKHGARWSVPTATQRFTHEKNGSVFPTMVRVKAPVAESYHRNKDGSDLGKTENCKNTGNRC